MKYFVRILSVLLTAVLATCMSPAHAQGVPLPSCLHGFEGKPAPYMPRWERGAAGHHVYFWCIRASDGAIRTEGFSCPHSVCDLSKYIGVMADITASADKVAAAKVAWATNLTYTCGAVKDEQTPRGAACRERQVIFNQNSSVWLAGLGQSVPPAVVYVVAKNSAYLDRPSFAVVNGARSTSSKTRAVVGSTADCVALTIMEGTTRYCQVSATGASVFVAIVAIKAP